MSVTGSTVSSL